MNRTIWKWGFGISLTALILLIIFTFAIWALVNATGSFAATVMGDSNLPYLSMGQFLLDSVGSPMFYAYIIDFAILLSSTVMLIVHKK
ncbi:MAG: hypothetical protein J6A88_03745 [Oscillospiraceae bacterium]|nr:hypothetical protein [Oscillospiraceae bacterium]